MTQWDSLVSGPFSGPPHQHYQIKWEILGDFGCKLCQKEGEENPFTLNTAHSTLSMLHTAQCILHTVYTTVPTAHWKLHTVYCSLLKVHYILQLPNSDWCTLQTAHCTLHTAYWTLHTAHFTLQTSHWTLHTAHCTALYLSVQYMS